MIRQASVFVSGIVAIVNAENLRNLQPGQELSTIVTEKTYDFVTPPLGEDGEPNARIIGGEDVLPGEIPFYGYFLGETMCGGALITEDMFITAAHCLGPGAPLQIKIGATTTLSQNEGEVVSVCDSIIHPNHNIKSMSNDIAILKLCDPIGVSAYARYNTNPGYPSATGVDLWMVGFGRTEVDGGLSPFLQKGRVDYLNNGVCEERYDKYDGTMTMCADSPVAAICYGDSGGPLIDSSGLVVGLSSYIVDTCNGNYPDFFTRVSSYADWIEETVCEQAFNPPVGCPVVTGSQGEGEAEEEQDEDDDDMSTTDALLECFSLVLELVQSLLGRR